MKGICKAFGHVNVLTDIALSIADGEVHALMGENGAGKSTLIKILAGVYTRDSGTVTIDGVPVDACSITACQQLGIAYVHQELNVINDMSIADNLFLGRELRNRFGFIDRPRMNQTCVELLNELHLEHLSPDTLMRQLSVGYQQMIEIAKALLINARLIILDEPTAALTDKEIRTLFTIVRKLKAQGVSFLYVSHRMNEIFELSDRITVLRDGRYIGTCKTADVNEDDLVRMMTGRSIDNLYTASQATPGKTVLELRNLTSTGQFEDISFTLRAGEVLGFAGLMGAGRSEVMHGIFGSYPAETGEIHIHGQPVTIKTPRDASKHGIAFVTENRKEEGLILDFDLTENTTLPSLDSFRKNGLVNDAALVATTDQHIARLHIKTSGREQKLKNLSGGNQQKVVLAKWLETKPDILILDEPTRGVDIGAKKEIYDIINTLKQQGVAIIVVSSELSEVMGISDRLAIMHQRRLVKITNTDTLTQDQVLKYAFTGAQ